MAIASPSAIFQRTIESVLRGMPCTLVRADDILVSGHSDEEHLANVEKVLARLADAGLKAKRGKCCMMEPEVVYMGYVVNAHGHCSDPERVSAVLNAPAPKNVAELQSLPWNAQLLWPVHSQPGNYFGTPAPTFETRSKVGMEERTRRGIYDNKGKVV